MKKYYKKQMIFTNVFASSIVMQDKLSPQTSKAIIKRNTKKQVLTIQSHLSIVREINFWFIFFLTGQPPGCRSEKRLSGKTVSLVLGVPEEVQYSLLEKIRKKLLEVIDTNLIKITRLTTYGEQRLSAHRCALVTGTEHLGKYSSTYFEHISFVANVRNVRSKMLPQVLGGFNPLFASAKKVG